VTAAAPAPAAAASPGRLPEAGIARALLEAELAELCARDHGYGRESVFNSISSAPLPIAAAVYRRFLDRNLGDPRIFPGPAEAERRVGEMLADLLGCPPAGGCLTSGGTEANLLAMSLALDDYRARGGDPARAAILAPETVHFSFDKIARLLRMRLLRTPLDGRLRGDVPALVRRAGAETAAIVVSAGASETGAVDDVAAAAAEAERRGIYLHVDAATGGFLLPFAPAALYDGPRVDFAAPGVRSVTVDPHKYGYAPIPAGYLLLRRAEDERQLHVASHYAGTHDHRTLLGTRPGAAALAVYAALRSLGRAGYRSIVADLFSRRAHLLRLLADAGFTLAAAPDLTVVAVRVGGSLRMLAALEAEGLLASVSRRFDFLRIVVQRHTTRPALARLVAAMARHERLRERPA
jgi:tyrosine decarboxylase/aspartate 1-decarboxylase